MFGLRVRFANTTIQCNLEALVRQVVLNKLEEQWGGHRFASLGRRLVKEGDLVKISRRYGT